MWKDIVDPDRPQMTFNGTMWKDIVDPDRPQMTFNGIMWKNIVDPDRPQMTFNGTMWKDIVEPDRPQMTIWRMRIACWIPKATNTLSEYLMVSVFPLKECLHDRA